MKLLPLIVIVFVVVTLVRAFSNAIKAKSDARAAGEPDESEEQQRVREIQERIRRIAAERGGQAAPMAAPPMPVPQTPPPRLFGTPTPQLDPFGGPGRRILTTFERRLQQGMPPPIPADARTAEVEREEQFEEEKRVLEEDKVLAARHRAVDVAALVEEAQSEPALRATARERLLEDLRDPAGLRRAFVLREVLGTPVGLR